MTDKDISMTTRVEVTKKYAQAYHDATKKQKGQILDTVIEITDWNRDHARQQLVRRLQQTPGRAQATVAVLDRRRTKPRKYSYDALRVLQYIWSIAGGVCGKCLHASMLDWITSLENSGTSPSDTTATAPTSVKNCCRRVEPSSASFRSA